MIMLLPIAWPSAVRYDLAGIPAVSWQWSKKADAADA